MNFTDMSAAIREAENTLSLADSFAEKFARMLVGRLRKVGSTYLLSQLKRELRDFNIHTGAWKE